MSDTIFDPVSTQTGTTTPEAGRSAPETVIEEPECLVESDMIPETAQESIANSLATSQAAESHFEAFNSNSIFIFSVGNSNHQFTVDINDLRRESKLFRRAPIITSIELKHSDPSAFTIITNWFSGDVGTPPYTDEDIARYKAAIEMARQLQIKECEAQLAVIVAKTSSIIEHCLLDELTGRPRMDGDQIMNRINTELKAYMIRSTNVGGRDDSDGEV